MTDSGNYKEQLTKARSLLARGRATLFEVVTLAVSILRNKDFRADLGLLDDFESSEWLDAELFHDYQLGILQLEIVLKEFPKAADWKVRPLRELFDEAKAKNKPPEAEKTTRTVTRVTKAEHKVVVDKLEEVKHRNVSLESRMTDMEIENRDLKLEVANLKGQISRMEMMLKRDVAMV